MLTWRRSYPVNRFINWLNSHAGFRAVIVTFILTMSVFSIVPLANLAAGRGAKDYQLWFDTARIILNGGDIYPAGHHKFPFMYPPAAAEMLAPLSLLGLAGLIAVLVVLNSLAWWACSIWSARLTTNERRRQHVLLYLLPNLVIVLYVWASYLLGQPTLLLLALLLAGFLCLRTRQSWAAGFLFALAAAIKAFPFLAIIYLIYRRYWVAAISMLVSLVLLLPAPVRGWSRARHDLAQWSEGMLFKYNEKGVAQRPARSNTWKNQSIFGVANRLLRPVDVEATRPPDKPVFVNLANFSFQSVNAIIAAAGLLLGLSYIAAMPRASRRTAEMDAIEWALLLLLMLMFTPLSFGYLYSFLLFPLTIIVQTWLVRPKPPVLGWALGALLLLALTIPFPRAAQKYGNIFFATLLLFIGLLLELRQLKRAPAEA